MKKYLVEIKCCTEAKGGGGLEAHSLAVMDALLEEPGVIDPDITAELTTGIITLAMGIKAATDGKAVEHAMVAARSAIHKAGGWTPRWGEGAKKSEFEIEEGFDVRVRPAGMAAC